MATQSHSFEFVTRTYTLSPLLDTSSLTRSTRVRTIVNRSRNQSTNPDSYHFGGCPAGGFEYDPRLRMRVSVAAELFAATLISASGDANAAVPALVVAQDRGGRPRGRAAAIVARR